MLALGLYPSLIQPTQITRSTLFIEAYLVLLGVCIALGFTLPRQPGSFLVGSGIAGLTLTGIAAILSIGLILLVLSAASLTLAFRIVVKGRADRRVFLLGCALALAAGLAGQDVAAHQVQCSPFGHDEGNTLTITGPVHYECANGRPIGR